jgi:hypothetical protein
MPFPVIAFPVNVADVELSTRIAYWPPEIVLSLRATPLELWTRRPVEPDALIEIEFPLTVLLPEEDRTIPW